MGSFELEKTVDAIMGRLKTQFEFGIVGNVHPVLRRELPDDSQCPERSKKRENWRNAFRFLEDRKNWKFLKMRANNSTTNSRKQQET